MTMSDDDEQLRELTKQFEEKGFQVIHDDTWGDIVWRPGTEINPSTDSNRDLAELREMLAGIEWGREHGTIKPEWRDD